MEHANNVLPQSHVTFRRFLVKLFSRHMLHCL